jgi:hypothetical protein
MGERAIQNNHCRVLFIGEARDMADIFTKVQRWAPNSLQITTLQLVFFYFFAPDCTSCGGEKKSAAIHIFFIYIYIFFLSLWRREFGHSPLLL